MINRGMEVLDDHSLLDSFAGPLVGCKTVKITPLDAASKQQDATGICEMAVHAVKFQVFDFVGHVDLVFHLLVRFALDERVAAKFACEHDESLVEQAALLDVED